MARSKKVSIDAIIDEQLKKPLLRVEDLIEYEVVPSVPPVKEEVPKEEVVYERKLVKMPNGKWEWQ